MMTKLSAVSFILALCITQPSVVLLLAQDSASQSGWATVKALSAGDKLLIETKNGERLEGRLSSLADSSGLTLIRKGKAMSFNQSDIHRIYRLGGGSRVKSTLLGTGIGAGIGGGVGAAVLGATGGSDETTAFIATVSLLGAGIGAAVGSLVGKGSTRVLIYESR